MSKFRENKSKSENVIKWKNKILISQVPHPEFRVQFSEKHKMAKIPTNMPLCW